MSHQWTDANLPGRIRVREVQTISSHQSNTQTYRSRRRPQRVVRRICDHFSGSLWFWSHRHIDSTGSIERQLFPTVSTWVPCLRWCHQIWCISGGSTGWQCSGRFVLPCQIGCWCINSIVEWYRFRHSINISIYNVHALSVAVAQDVRLFECRNQYHCFLIISSK